MREKLLPITCDGIDSIKELFNSIKAVKVNTWEKALLQRIQSIREKELGLLRKTLNVQTQATTMAVSIAITASIVTFIALT